MSDRTFARKKTTATNLAQTSLISSTTPTLANPTRGFGLPTNNVIQKAADISTEQQEVQAGDQESSLEQLTIQEKPLTHDISRISFHRPQAKLTVGEPGDQYEQQADWVANRVMRMIAADKPNFPNHIQSKLPNESIVQRQELSTDGQTEQTEEDATRAAEIDRIRADQEVVTRATYGLYSTDGLTDVAVGLNAELMSGRLGERMTVERARTLISIYHILETRLQSPNAHLDEDGLPQPVASPYRLEEDRGIDELDWDSSSPLAGIVDDILPFGNLDYWITLTHSSSTTSPHRRARARGGTTEPEPDISGVDQAPSRAGVFGAALGQLTNVDSESFDVENAILTGLSGLSAGLGFAAELGEVFGGSVALFFTDVVLTVVGLYYTVEQITRRTLADLANIAGRSALAAANNLIRHWQRQGFSFSTISANDLYRNRESAFAQQFNQWISSSIGVGTDRQRRLEMVQESERQSLARLAERLTRFLQREDERFREYLNQRITEQNPGRTPEQIESVVQGVYNRSIHNRRLQILQEVIDSAIGELRSARD